MSKKKQAPACEWCGCNLKRYRVNVLTSYELKPGDEIGHPYQPDRRVIVQHAIKGQLSLMANDDAVFWSVWYGEYGVDGNNHFCTKTCGYRYACDVASKKD